MKEARSDVQNTERSTGSSEVPGKKPGMKLAMKEEHSEHRIGPTG